MRRSRPSPLAAIASLAGCSPKNRQRRRRSIAASNVKLTAGSAAAHPPLHRRTGQIAQDGRHHRRRRLRQRSGHQRAGALLRPGVAAARSPGDAVRKGAAAGGGGFAGLRGGRRRLSQGARDRRRPTAGLPIWTRISSSIRAFRGAKRSRRKPTPSAPRPTAMPRCRRSSRWASIRRPSRTFARAGRLPRIEGVNPLADRRNRGGKTDHARLASAGGHHAVFHRGRSLARLGDGAGFDSDLASVSVGDTAEVRDRHRLERLLRERSTTSPALVDPNTRSVAVRVVVDNPGGLLKRQMYVRVLIQSPPGEHRTAGAGFGGPARRREPAVRLCRPARRQLCAAACDARLLAPAIDTTFPTGLQRRRPDRGRRRPLHSVHAESMSDDLPRRSPPRNAFDHEPDRGVFAGAALSRRADDARADRRRRPGAAYACRSTPIPICRRPSSRSSRNGRDMPPRKWSG